MGKSRNGSEEVRPHVRSQSPERSFETVHRLFQEYGRRTFAWVDPTFNVSPRWSDGWAELMLRSELVDGGGQPRAVHTAWMRSDCVIRDEKSGVLEKLVRAGVRQVMIGVERDDDSDLSLLSKHNNGAEVCREAFAIFRERYPEVFTVGSVIYGLPGDTIEDLKRLTEIKERMGMDFCFFIPLTPNPGTDIVTDARFSGLVPDGDTSQYNFHTPVCETERLDRRKLESIYWRFGYRINRRQISATLRGCFLEPDARKRRLHRSFFKHGAGIFAGSLYNRLLHPISTQPALHSRKPPWYDS